jgi:hypothetical protein
MPQSLRHLTVPILNSSTFFIAGFFIAAELFGLSPREIAIGLVAGLICGVTTLVATVRPELREAEPA